MVLLETIPDLTTLSRPFLNKLLADGFVARGWASQPAEFDDPHDPGAPRFVGFHPGIPYFVSLPKSTKTGLEGGTPPSFE